MQTAQPPHSIRDALLTGSLTRLPLQTTSAIVAGITILLLSALAAVPAHSQQFLGFSDNVPYSTQGNSPSVAVYGGEVIEVRNATQDGGLVYKVGRIKKSGNDESRTREPTIVWGPDMDLCPQGVSKCSFGYNPSVSMSPTSSGLLAIVVYNVSHGAGAINYCSGFLVRAEVGGQVSWNCNTLVGQGYNPSVALVSVPCLSSGSAPDCVQGLAVEVHNASAGVSPVLFSIAAQSANSAAFSWPGMGLPFDENGGNPTVAAHLVSQGSGAGDLEVVEVDNSSDIFGELGYRTGFVDLTHKPVQLAIHWAKKPTNIHSVSGQNPRIAYNGNFLIEVYNGVERAGPLWYRLGSLDHNFGQAGPDFFGPAASWNASQLYQNCGYNPSVAIDPIAEGQSLASVIEVHNGGSCEPVSYHLERQEISRP